MIVRELKELAQRAERGEMENVQYLLKNVHDTRLMLWLQHWKNQNNVESAAVVTVVALKKGNDLWNKKSNTFKDGRRNCKV